MFTHVYNTDIGYATCSVTDDSGNTVFSKSLHVLTNGIIKIPDDYPTIQRGIDAAFDHANVTVLVADGIYKGEENKNLNFNGKAITVQSENGPENCVIHCERAGRGFKFENYETKFSVVSGLTIMYGMKPHGYSGGFDGGGISCKGASPTITNCTIVKNEGHNGGGISFYGG